MTTRNPTRDTVTDMFRRFAGQANNLTIPRPYIDLCKGDHLAALLLSQILYWTDRTSDEDGWFAKSYDEWYAELAMTEYQVKRSINGDKRAKHPTIALKDFGVESKLKSSKFHQGAATLHYRVDLDKLQQSVLDFVQNGVLDNVQNGGSTMFRTTPLQCSELITETTTETTTEIIKDNIATDVASKELSEVKLPQSEPLLQEPKAVEPEPPPTFAAPPPVVDTIAAGIKAYIDGLIAPPASNQYGNTTNRKAVKCIIDAGFTAEQITHYTKAIQAQDYWKGKKPPLTTIADGIAAYYAQHAPKILILPEMETPPVEPPDVPRGLAAGIDPELVKQMIEDLALAKAV